MRPRATIVYGIVFLDLVLMFAIVPLLPAYQRELDMSKAQAGLVVAAYSAAVLFASVPVGHWADRLGPHRVTVAGAALLALSTVGYAAVDSFWLLFLVRAGQGLSSAISWTAGLAWLSAETPVERRGQRLGTAMACATVGALLGPVAAGPLGAAYGIRVPFVVLGAVAGVVAVVAAFAPAPARAEVEQLPLRASIGAALRRGPLLAALVITLLVAVVSGTMDTLVPLRLGAAGYSATAITVVLTVSGVISVVTNRVVGGAFDRVGGVPIALLAIAGTAVGLLVMAISEEAAVQAAVFIAVTPFITGQYAVSFPLCADGADRVRMGHSVAFGLVNLTWGGGFAIGPAAGAAIAAASSDRVTYAILLVASGLVLARLRPLALAT
jgi:MFS transporter, DHA1 family, solute carrier family 18 (vesicular amine transporter), member 1/2